MFRNQRLAILLVLGMVLSAIVDGCAPTGQSYQPYGYGPRPGQYGNAARSARPISSVQLSSLPDTIGIEYSDRINRLNRLSSVYGITPPQIDQLQVNPTPEIGADYPIPVIRIVFPERVFFDFDKDMVRPEATKILDLIADNMRRDVPDARVLILGHTDAIGTDAYNIDLSKRRAVSVMQELIRREVRPSELATVAIGKSQPIASNDTDEGRALNRRVEFMISASQEANLTLVEKRKINEAFLRTATADTVVEAAPAIVQVFTPTVEQPIARPSAPGPQEASLPPPAPIVLAPTKTIQLQKPEYVQPKEREVVEPQERKLDDEFNL
jgi:outer membrane protein OmpA-like peptidoglycan-associated protein